MYEATEFFYDMKFCLGSENITESYSVRILGTETNSVRHPLGRSKKFCPAAFGLGAEFFQTFPRGRTEFVSVPKIRTEFLNLSLNHAILFYSDSKKEETQVSEPPKKPLTAFGLFKKDQTEKMKMENPDKTGQEINQEISRLWKASYKSVSTYILHFKPFTVW